MMFLITTAVILATVFMYYFLMVWPATFLAWLHVPSWLILGVIGGFVAWCMADD